jgi:hypothetical protein
VQESAVRERGPYHQYRQGADTVPSAGRRDGRDDAAAERSAGRASGRELRELQQFLLYLGSALTAAGEAVNEVEMHQLRGVLRLDQTAALFEVLKAAERGEPLPEEGSRRIRQIMDMRPRFGPSVTILGHVVLTVGICLVLQPTWAISPWRRCSGRWSQCSSASVVAGRASR